MGVSIAIPSDAYYSFFNSPYVGHQQSSSLDIYPAHGEWGGSGFSPVSGRVTIVRRFKMGRKKDFVTSDYDYAIGIQPSNDEEHLVRLLHCHPVVKRGDSIEAGEEVGSLIRSRYFNFWTAPHYHIDVMTSRDFNRSSQSHTITSAINLSPGIKIHGQYPLNEVDWTIRSVTADCAIASSSRLKFGELDGIYGHIGEIGSGVAGLLDGGINHYPLCGFFGANGNIGMVHIGNEIIGSLDGNPRGAPFFHQNRLHSIFLDELKIRGISTYIASKHQLVSGLLPLKLIPLEYKGFENLLKEGDTCRLILLPHG